MGEPLRNRVFQRFFFFIKNVKGGAEMKKTDLILVVIALIAAAGIWLFYSAGADHGLTAVVTVDGEVRAELPMDKNGIVPIETEWGYNIVVVEEGEAFVVEADCRDQICVDHKKIEKWRREEALKLTAQNRPDLL